MIARLYTFLYRIILVVACLVVAGGVALIASRFPYHCLFLLAFLLWRKYRRRGGSTWSHGTARIATLKEMVRGGLQADSGLILGRVVAYAPTRCQAVCGLLSPAVSSDMACRQFLDAFLGTQWLGHRTIRTFNYVHLAVFARTGAGKGVSFVIPILLSYFKSLVAIDIKGELYKTTAKHRRKRLRHRVIRLDPLGVAGPAADSDTLNVLDFIDEASDDFVDQCRDVADQLVTRTGKEHDSHWLDSAVLVITAIIAFVCVHATERGLRNLRSVRKIVSSRDSYLQAVETMQQIDAFGGILQLLGGSLSWFRDKELGSVLTTVQRMLQFLDSPAIGRNVEKSSFDPKILLSGKATIYLILPYDKLTVLAPLQRLWIGTIMRVSTRGGASEKNQMLWLLDEIAHIGPIKVLEEAVTLYRGMGVRLFFFFQSLGQVKDCFGDRADTFLDNIGTQIFFGIRSFESADAVSKHIGETTIAITSANHSSSQSRTVGGGGPNATSSVNTSESSGVTHSDMARRIFKPEEILTLDGNTALILHNNMPVVVARLLRYYNAPEFRWGGTGKPRRLNFLAAGVLTGFTLLASVAFAYASMLIATMPLPEATRPGFHSGYSRQAVQPYDTLTPFGGNGGTMPADFAGDRGMVRPFQRRRKPAYGAAGGGTLIPIQ